jgi:hypothetical protein
MVVGKPGQGHTKGAQLALELSALQLTGSLGVASRYIV